MPALAVSIMNKTERTFEITNLTLNNCTGSTNTLVAGTPIGQNKTVADIFGASNDQDYGGTMTVRNYLTSRDYVLTFNLTDFGGTKMAGFDASPDNDTGLVIQADAAKDSDDFVVIFTFDPR
jgi:hypothetical protein